MKKSSCFWICQLSILLLSLGCTEKKHPSKINFEEVPLPKLSDYGFYTGNLKDLNPTQGLLLYEPSSPLFTDYAYKSRYVWMPSDSSAFISKNAPQLPLNFPDHTILIKNFYYPVDFSSPEKEKQIIETRLLVKYKGKWDAYPYLWNDDQTDANYKMIGAVLPVTFSDNHGKTHTIDYVQPNKNQCKSCHNQNEEFIPLGPKARNLNFTLEYKNGESINQLVKWVQAGYLKNFTQPDHYPAVVNYEDESKPLADRTLAYLDANCGHCHNPNGPGNTSGLYLTYEKVTPSQMGIFKPPVAAGTGTGPHTFDIYPGYPDSSIVVYRMNSVDPAVMMPEIGRVMIHTEGIELVRKWIADMATSSSP